MEIMNINEILEYMPHRYPFVLIDRVIELQVEKSVVAIKNVTYNEQFFTGHFPGQPVMPGVLIVEALAQTGGMLAVKTVESRGIKRDGTYYFAAIESVRFKRVVVPGDQLRLAVELLKHKQDVWKFKGVATVDGNIVCSAEFTNVRREA